MIHRSLPYSCRLAPITGGSIVCAVVCGVLAIASAAQAQTTAPRGEAPSAGQPAALVHRIAESGDQHGPGIFADLAEKVGPAVIGVSSKSAATRNPLPDQSFEFGTPEQNSPEREMPDGRGEDEAPKSLHTTTIGTGFFISPDGYAVTNSHIVEDADTAEIRTHDNKTYSAKVVGKDPLSGLALIKVDGSGPFNFVKLADEPPRAGDWVLAAGNSFGLGASVTAGIVSARERDIEIGSATNFIQIDAKINKGDSGGPSFNTNGEVIGVNSMIFSPSQGSVGVAFAIPVETMKEVIPQLKEKGAVKRGWIGAEVQPVTPEIAEGLGVNDLHGAIVASVQRDGPAAKAGLKSGDVITSVDGEAIKDAKELTRKIRAIAPGSSIRIATLREGKENSLKVALGQLPDEPRPTPPAPR
jgi:serine protease Do